MKFTKTVIACTLLVSMLGVTAFADSTGTAPTKDCAKLPQAQMLAIPAAHDYDYNNENDKDIDGENGKDIRSENNQAGNRENDKEHKGDQDKNHDAAHMKIEATAIAATIGGVDVSGTIKGKTATLKMPVSGALSMLKIEGTDGVALTVNKVKGTNTKAYTNKVVFPDMQQISIAQIMGNPANTTIDVASLRALLGDSDKIVLSGTLSKENYKSKKVKLILDFSETVGQYSNAYFDAEASGRTVTVAIKQPDALISTIGMKNMILGVSQSSKLLPNSVTLGEGADKETFTNLLDAATQNAIRDKVGSICGTWTTATLSDLNLKSDELNMKLHDIAGETINVIFTEM